MPKSKKPTALQRLETLKAIQMFSDLPVGVLRKIRNVAGEVEVPAGQVLVQPNQEGSGMYIVEEGAVVVERRGNKIELGPGECFGELALLTAHKRTARVRAKGQTRLLTIDRYHFRELLESEPKIAVKLLEMVADRFAHMIEPGTH
ncbi:MAG: cyclic nucleotide-binding domain-containing protein [Actinomycetota bacterium]